MKAHRTIYPHRKHSGHRQAGFLLIEGLIATALLLVVAVSTLPLFTRALENNLSGGRSSQLSTFVVGDIESVNQTPVDQDAWMVGTTPEGVLDLDSRYWDMGPLYDTDTPNFLGDEKWIASEDEAEGLILWSRSASVRKYSLADIQIVISSDAGGVVTGGDDPSADFSPMLFDNPLTDDSNAHLTEMRVTIREQRGTLAASTGRGMTVGHFRAF